MCLDGVDACPTEPEDGNAYMDEDGCPEPDRDADGWPDELDNCPDVAQAEDERGDLDDDGLGDLCDEDMDGDGLNNECEIPDSMTCPFSCAQACADELDGCNGCADTDPTDFDSDDGGVGDGEETLTRGSDPLDPIDDPLPGEVTGGGVFQCRAADGPGQAPGLWLWLFAFAAIFRRRNRKGGC
jgi:MYXO-CTERM domain-containing protein